MAGKVRRSALDSHVLPICSLPLQFVSLNGNKYLNYINDLISRAKKALPCGEGLGVGVVVRYASRATTTTPTTPAFAALRRATLPTRGRVKTEFAARADATHLNTPHSPEHAYSSATWPSLMTLAHFSVSAATSLPKSAGVPGVSMPPRSAKRALMLGSASAALISLLSLSTISGGVPFGTPIP